MLRNPLVSACALIALAGHMLCPPAAQAQMPRTLSYQGVLADNAGNLVADGVRTLALTLYDAATGGAAVFTETQTVTVVRGTFNAILGAATAGGIPPVVAFDRAYFLGVRVDGGAELTPRVPLTASPYALRAAIADAVAAGSVTTQHLAPGAVDASRLAMAAVDATKLAPGAVVPGVIAPGAVTNAAIADGAISGAKIADGSLTVAKLDGTGAIAGQVLASNGAAVGFVNDSLQLPFTGTGTGSVFNVTSNNRAVLGTTTGTSTSAAGVYGLSSAGNSAGVYGHSTATGALSAAVYGRHDGLGSAGWFETFSSGSTQAALQATSLGAGPAFRATTTGTATDIAAFSSNLDTVARIDQNGRGYFDDGTQTGGADIAEIFDVVGDVGTYEPGDVLVIATTRTRTVERSRTARSTLVAGVYATKPGVLLTEQPIDADHAAAVPLGVVGVIPTKVSAENGPIAIGDLLVTSSTPGHAMRAGGDPPPGSILGKALEPFAGTAARTGRIRVLVGVR